MARKKVYDENGNEVKRGGCFSGCFKWLGIGVVALIVLSVIIGVMGEDQTTDTTNTAESEPQEETENDGQEENQSSEQNSQESQEQVVPLVEQYDQIQLGENGSTQEEVTEMFGEPDSTSETSVGGVNSTSATWSGLEGGDLFSAVTVSFSDGIANSKSVAGLPVEEGDAITREDFDSIPTDGTYTYDQAMEELGQPNGFSESVIAGTHTNMVSWTTNAEGDLGSNFNVTFQDGVATSKAQGGLQ